MIDNLDFFIIIFLADDPKNTHLRELEGGKERLILCKADLQDYEALKAAIDGCDGVFHTASPVTDDPVSLFLGFSICFIAFLVAYRENRIKLRTYMK